MGWQTLTEAGSRVGLSARTLKRRIDEGALSAAKRPWRGKLTAWMVEDSELARWAEVQGLSMTLPDTADTPGGNGGGPGQRWTGTGDDTGQVMAAGAASPDSDGQMISALQAEAAALRSERDFLRETVQALTTMALPAAREERDRLADRAAEAARQAKAAEAVVAELREELEHERRRTWWQRLTGK